MQQLTNGTLLHGGTYKIVKMLGQGSFGITYLAEHTLLCKKVALKEFFMKELNSRCADNTVSGIIEGSLSHTYAVKFKKEAINLSGLSHENIVKVTDSFEENGTFYYAMDYVEGCNLNEYISLHKIDNNEAIGIISHVADALIYMHDSKHMLHLDLKPGNIMRSSDGHVYLIDFGLSKHYSASGEAETSTTIGQGTAGYAPIEQANPSRNGEFRPAIDVYALGATLYKLLTCETPPAASELVSDDHLLSYNLDIHGIIGGLQSFIIDAMSPNVRRRIQNMKDFKAGLTAVMNNNYSPLNIIENNEETLIANNTEDIIANNSEETIYTDSPKSKTSVSYGKLILAIFVFIGLGLGIWGYNSYQNNIKEQAQQEFVNKINYTNDFYIDNSNQIYCTIDGVKEIVNQVPDGNHTIHFSSNDTENRKSYQGHFVNGERDGDNATMTWNNGDVFRGTFKKNQIVEGTYSVKSDGSYFTGSFRNNAPYNGKWYNSNGAFLQNVKNGF